jgi:GTP-binding protein Era
MAAGFQGAGGFDTEAMMAQLAADRENEVSAADLARGDRFASGFLALVGRPNAGKSTLLNALVGKKVAITSNTAQTTRNRFRGIVNRPHAQVVIVDTPGIHKPKDALGRDLNQSAARGMEDVDVVAFLLDAGKPFGRGDDWVLRQVKGVKAKRILVVSKTDTADRKTVDGQIEAASEWVDWDAVCPLSSVTGDGVAAFLDTVIGFLPEGPRWFPEDMDTDQSLEAIVAEFIREKILRHTYDEVPHSVGVLTEDIDFDEERRLYHIEATVYVERDSQKGIIIGQGGKGIKAIGTEARQDLEQLLGARVYLGLQVRVRKNWRQDESQIRRFGYGEGE